MAPIKFEENIREKLQERELTPSKDAWSKLAGQLDEAPQKKRYPFTWFAIAASFVGVLLLVNFFVSPESGMDTDKIAEEELIVNPSDENGDTKLPVLTDQNEEVHMAEISSEKRETNTKDIYVEMKELADFVADDAIKGGGMEKKISEEASETVRNRALVTKVTGVDSNNDFQNGATQDLLIKAELDLIDTEMAVETNTELETQFMKDKVNEVVAKVKGMQDANASVTAEEIDALLKRAQRDISTERILSQKGTKIDATALLQDVETQLERTFRDRVFEALGEGYSKVRTAVVERNN